MATKYLIEIFIAATFSLITKKPYYLHYYLETHFKITYLYAKIYF